MLKMDLDDVLFKTRKKHFSRWFLDMLLKRLEAGGHIVCIENILVVRQEIEIDNLETYLLHTYWKGFIRWIDENIHE